MATTIQNWNSVKRTPVPFCQYPMSRLFSLMVLRLYRPSTISQLLFPSVLLDWSLKTCLTRDVPLPKAGLLGGSANKFIIDETESRAIK